MLLLFFCCFWFRPSDLLAAVVWPWNVSVHRCSSSSLSFFFSQTSHSPIRIVSKEQLVESFPLCLLQQHHTSAAPGMHAQPGLAVRSFRRFYLSQQEQRILLRKNVCQLCSARIHSEHWRSSSNCPIELWGKLTLQAVKEIGMLHYRPSMLHAQHLQISLTKFKVPQQTPRKPR